MRRETPYKVIVWAPGYLGTACIREILKRPEFELVGVLAYSESKNGKDVGELLGIDPIGVTMTTDQEKIFNMKADCVLHAGTNIMDDTPRNQEVVRLLESGKNVIAAPSYHFPQIHGPEFVAMLTNACQKGGVSLHGTGINPGFFAERLAVTLTGMVNEIDYIRCQEYFDLKNVEAVRMLKACTFGMTLEKAQSIIGRIEKGSENYYHSTVAHACHILGHDVERIAVKSTFTPAREDMHLKASGVTIKKGEVACWEHTWTGYVDGKPFFFLDEIFYLGQEYCPVETKGDHYRIIIEGKPVSVNMKMDLMASVEKDLHYREGDNTTPGYYATAMPMIQTIPVVCEAAPGIVYPTTFAHYARDYRNLVAG
ncbi:hypothetical protein Gmet_2230 [Geobacter metallireducens GS-15]|uniref:Dihydrodipicolinate reductase N-terminal domain-containing protein n=1 Tax=Geobacter metallireducens (strain ATCC 53774 / DSM 7210 / GS-15) TaxID=269799 RepID=Q39TG7_GEOMG|nr:hypothetical protein [Geobacter metallireducens]ABB32457.1 hypothetical protein Gmet_2230 [Geobacter metallireducens GS-15]